MKNPVTEAITNCGGYSVLARALDQSRQSIMSWEQKGIPPKFIRAVSEVSDVSIESLLQFTEEYQQVDHKATVKAMRSELNRALKAA